MLQLYHAKAETLLIVFSPLLQPCKLQLYHAKAETSYMSLFVCDAVTVATLPCQSGNHNSVRHSVRNEIVLQLYHAKAETRLKLILKYRTESLQLYHAKAETPERAA